MQAINCCLGQGIFPDNAKIVSVVPVDKEKPDKCKNSFVRA